MNMQEGRFIDVSDEDFDREVLESDLPVLVDFWAPWCAPRRTAAPMLARIANAHKGKLKLCRLNVSEERQTAFRYHVNNIPRLYIFKGGQVVAQVVGLTSTYESDIKDKIEPYLDER